MSKPSNVILAARTTQELTIDRTAVANLIQNTFESIPDAYGITKKAIEPNVAAYTINYGVAADVIENLYDHHRAQSENGRGGLISRAAKDSKIERQENDTVLHMQIDLNDTFGMTSVNTHVSGIMRDQAIPDKSQALGTILKAVKLSEKGLFIDGQKLLAGIDGLIQLPQINFEGLSEEQKRAMKDQVYYSMKNQYESFGIDLSRKGDKVNISWSFDKILAKLESLTKESPTGITVNRKTPGEATIIVDYKQLVDMAFFKAQAILNQVDPSKRNKLENLNEETSKLTISNGGLEGLLNKAIDEGARLIINQTRQILPKGLENMQTIAQKEQSGRSGI